MQGFDVGGSHKSQQSGYEVFGVQNQARTVSDGVDHTEGVGGTGFYEDYYANEEVSISALGSDVEMNSPGAAIVTTIKSGGNTFKGLEHFSYEPGKFVGTNAATSDIQSRGFTCPENNFGVPKCGNPNIVFWEAHADLGGPIAKDKVWFYGAYNHFKIDKEVAGVDRSLATDLGIFDNFTGKVTGKAGQANTLIGYFQQGRKQKPRRGLSNLVPPESVRAQDSYSRSSDRPATLEPLGLRLATSISTTARSPRIGGRRTPGSRSPRACGSITRISVSRIRCASRSSTTRCRTARRSSPPRATSRAS